MYKERFTREVISQSKCQHHNIFSIYICELFNIEIPSFIMGLAECDLQSLLSTDLSEDEKMKIISMVCEGVAHIHRLGYLHRDIKPCNILRYENWVYKISDFGLVRKTIPSGESDVLTSLNIRLGTDNFVAPELMYIGSDYTEKSDILAIGKVFEQLQVKDTRTKKS